MAQICGTWRDEFYVGIVVIIEIILWVLINWRNNGVRCTREYVDWVISKIWGRIDVSICAVAINSIIGIRLAGASIESQTSTSKNLTLDGFREDCSQLMSNPRSTRVSKDNDSVRMNIEWVQGYHWVSIISPCFNRWDSSSKQRW